MEIIKLKNPIVGLKRGAVLLTLIVIAAATLFNSCGAEQRDKFVIGFSQAPGRAVAEVDGRHADEGSGEAPGLEVLYADAQQTTASRSPMWRTFCASA